MIAKNNKLTSIDDALGFLLQQAKPQTTSIIKPLNEVLGYILANDIKSNINVPEFDNSAVDGFACRINDNDKPPYKLNIKQRITAGKIGSSLDDNCAARIFTGAATPNNTYAVVMQEECRLTDNSNSVIIAKKPAYQENIRPKANDIKQGNTILTKGIQLKPQDIALIASIGISEVAVFTQLTVGVFFTGNELLTPGEKLSLGKIYDSNSYSIIALLKNLNCNIINLGNIGDDFTTTCDVLLELSKKCNLIITTGGASVGEEDYIKPAVEKLGELKLWRINIKPGKPLAFGNINNTHFIGLPGNPVSAIITFFLFATPFIRKLQGNKNIANKSSLVAINFSWQPHKRREFVRVRLKYDNAIPTAYPYPKQGSDVLSSLVWADGVVEMPENSQFSSGDVLNFYIIV